MKHRHVDDTLTFDERLAPFLMREADPEPLPSPTRVACVWRGDRYREVDALGTRRIVGRGTINRGAR